MLARIALWIANWYHWAWTRDHGRIAAGKPRSGKWPAVQKAWLRRHPTCAVCGSRKNVNVHHVRPFHSHPALELSGQNLITLCRQNGCHFLFGHCTRWDLCNPTVRVDATLFRGKVRLAKRRGGNRGK